MEKTDSILKLEAHRLRVAFNQKGVKHIWDFVQAYYPDKYDREAFHQFINCRAANQEFIDVLTEILKKINSEI